MGCARRFAVMGGKTLSRTTTRTIAVSAVAVADGVGIVDERGCQFSTNELILKPRL
jgi:hypothetical protein